MNFSLGIRPSGLLAATLLILTLPPNANAACSARSDGVGLCPYVAGPVVFDRCFGAPLSGAQAGRPAPIGTTVCDAAKHAKALPGQIGANVDAWKRELDRDFNDFVRVTTDGTRGPDAVAAFNRAAGVWNGAVAEVQRLGRDRQCGPNGALKQAETWFKQTGGNLRQLGAIGGEVGNAVKAAAPAGAAALTVAQQAAGLVGDLAKSGGKAKKEAEQLKRSAETLVDSVKKVLDMNPAGLAADGVKIAANVGGFATATGLCAGSIMETVAAVAAGGTGATGGTAACLPSGGGGCTVALASAGGGALGTGGGLVIGGVSCEKSLEGAANLGEYIGEIVTFIETTVELATRVGKAIDDAGKSIQALNDLAQQAGAESKSRVQAMGEALNDVSRGLQAGLTVIQRKVAPPLTQLGEDMLTQMAGHTDTVVGCYNKVGGAVGRVADRGMQAGLETLKQAAGVVGDGITVLTNLANQSDAALSAAHRELGQRWAQVDRRGRDLYTDVFGVPAYQVDPVRTAAYMVANLNNLNRARTLLRDAQNLAREHDAAIAAALDSGKQAFLGRSGANDAKRKFETAIQKARAAETQMKRAGAAFKPVNVPRARASRLPMRDLANAQRARVQTVNVSALTRALQASPVPTRTAEATPARSADRPEIASIRASKGGYLILGKDFGRDPRAIVVLENGKRSGARVTALRDDRIDVASSAKGRVQVQVTVGTASSNAVSVTLR